MGSVEKILNGIMIHLGQAGHLLNNSHLNPVILFYHGVTANHTGPDDKHINYKIFRDQLVSLKKYFKFVKVEDIPKLLSDGNIDQPYLSVTFDDGYKNNINNAAGILDELNIPATFFISTGYIGEKRWMWTDLLEYSINHTKKETLFLDGLGVEIDLRDKNKNSIAINTIKRKLKKVDFNKVEMLAYSIASELLDGAIVDPFGDYEFMTWKDVKSLDDAGFDIGAHTVNHPILSNIDISQAEREIIDSKNIIIENIGRCSNIFCYPNGKRSDYNSDVIDVCEKNFSAALTTNYGYVSGDKSYELNRIGISNLLQGNTLIRRIINQTLDS